MPAFTSIFPVTSKLDDFNRANVLGLGPNWTPDPEAAGYASFDINSNRATPNTAFSAAYWNKTNFPADQEVFVTLAVLPVQAARVLARVTGIGVLATENNYEFEVDGSLNSFISRTFKGTRTTVSGALAGFSAGDQMGLRCVGDQIIAYKNGTEIGRVTDASHASPGVIAMVAQNDTTVRFEDFGGGDINPPTPITRGFQ